MAANRRRCDAQELKRLVAPKPCLVTPGQWTDYAAENVVIVDHRLVSELSAIDSAIGRTQLLAARVTALQKPPSASRTQRQMSIFKNAVIAKERIKPETGFIHFAPPVGACGRHE